MSENDKLIELLISEVQLLRKDINEMRKEIYMEIEKSNTSINTLKTRFMIVAVTMGVAGGKVSSILPFLK